MTPGTIARYVYGGTLRPNSGWVSSASQHTRTRCRGSHAEVARGSWSISRDGMRRCTCQERVWNTGLEGQVFEVYIDKGSDE
jgi:hypothetical protein